MNEAQTYRRAFSIGLLTLGVAVGGQVATSQPARRIECPRSARALYAQTDARPKTSLAHCIARVVVSAVRYSFS